MFAPFIIPTDSLVGDVPTVHWGNVDTGAMVNVVYLGVTRVFQHLQTYWVKYNHVLYGVGGKQTKIVAMLKDVPIYVGNRLPARRPRTDEPHDSASAKFSDCHLTTFLVVDNDDYHWILGIPLLSAINGMVKCRERTLDYTPFHSTSSTSLPLITRAEAKT